MKLPKIVFLLIVGIVLLTSLQTYLSDNRNSPDTPIPSIQPTGIVRQVTLVIDYGNGQKSTYIRPYMASQSAFALLENITAEKQIAFSYKKYTFGNLVENINNINNSPQMAWIYFVNSRSPEVGCDQYQIQPGDLIEWRYTKPE